MSEREISPEALDAAFRRLRQEVSLRVHAPPVATLIKKSRARNRRRLALAATASVAAVLATVFLLLPDDEVEPAPIGPVSVELSAPLVNGRPAAIAPGPEVWTRPPAQVEVTATNTGERPLDDVTATAGLGRDLTCRASTLDPDEATTCSMRFAPDTGQQALNVRLTAAAPGPETVSDRIVVFMRGTPPPRASVEVSDPTINDESAGVAPGPSVPPDQPALVEVVVTNSGERPLENVTATASPDGPELSCDAISLEVNDEMTCAVEARPEAGPGELDVRVSATDPDGETVSDRITVYYDVATPLAPAAAFLTADDANGILGSWTGATFSPTDATPSDLQFAASCAPDPLPDASGETLSDGQNSAISSTIAIFPSDGDAQQATADLVEQVSTCIDARPARDQLYNGLPAESATGTAQAFGAIVGTDRTSGQYEYIVIARDGVAVEVCAFAAFAQDTLPEATLDDLAVGVLDRLAAAG